MKAETNRIDRMFARCREQGRKALIVFLSAGDPSLGATSQAVRALAAAGADLVEIGVPFSDPMADGPVIQAASQRAIRAGFRMDALLEELTTLRRETDLPSILFSYYNVLLKYGIEKLAAASPDAGIDGWLLVDVPREEADEVQPHLDLNGVYRIPLVAPTTPRERIPYLLEGAGGFVYTITVKGITGTRTELPSDLAERLALVKSCSPLPVAAGFGVSGPAMAAAIAQHADAVVVGSLIVKTLAGKDAFEHNLERAVALVRDLARAMRP